jgi:sugar (pentulose or hexulose) kinase
VIGLDLGTSSCKAVAFTMDGQPLRSGRSPYETIREASGGVRQRPEDWWAAAVASLAAAVVPGRECLGVAVGGQIGTYLAVDHRIEPIAEAWTWQDGGPATVLGQLRETLDLAAIAEELRTWLPAGANWPLPRLLWLRDEHPGILSRTAFLMMPKDYVIHRLTGVAVTDPSSWRGLVTPEGELHHAALRSLGLPEVVAPRRPAIEPAGTLLPGVADTVGLPATVPVILGSSDFVCALAGTGIINEGDSFDIGGTSEHIGTLSGRAVHASGLIVVPHLLAAAPGSYVSYGVTSNAGSVSEWLGSTLLPHLPGTNRGETLSALAATPEAGRRPLFFLPHLSGERSPLWNADACGAWVGLRAEHDLADLVRAAFEGVAFNLRQIRESSPLTDRSQQLRITGGTARSSVWNQMKANALNAPLAVMAESDSTSVGAAIHAALGVGAYSTAQEAVAAMTRVSHVVDPEAAAAERYGEAYARYRAWVDLMYGTEELENRGIGNA